MEKNEEIILKGIPLSTGIAIGKLFLFNPQEVKVVPKIIESIEEEIQNFYETLKSTETELILIRENVSQKINEEKAKIFDVQILILQDPTLHEKVKDKILTQKLNWDFAFFEVMNEIHKSFLEVEEKNLRERAIDIHDVKIRVLRQNPNFIRKNLEIPEQAIVLAETLTPTDLIHLVEKNVAGFVTASGGINSHLAIIARTLGIPSILGSGKIFSQVYDDFLFSTVILDGRNGIFILDPTQTTVDYYREEKEKFEATKIQTIKKHFLQATTKGGISIDLRLNLSFENEFGFVEELNTQGVGLFRSEHLLFQRLEYPNEDLQFSVYRKLAENCFPFSARIRTFDVGGEKMIGNLQVPAQNNPCLGWRGIRISLEMQELFRTQLRAILKASYFGKLEIMLPMLTNLDEFLQAKEIIENVKNELEAEGYKIDRNIKTGVMIEVPSAAITADLLAKYCDFFSIGTNDLTQYVLAVDRNNNLVSNLYNPLHPSVLRLLKFVLEAGKKAKIPVNICGEIAGTLHIVPLLLGMGFDGLSVMPTSIPTVREVINQTNKKQLEKLAKKVFTLGSQTEIKKLLLEFSHKNLLVVS
ncbi:phosphoenolpyruvate--protein phosphotransferase [bacterium]|nr:phosphoenolpyruvate--protein phosphotransferase [bacterium]